MATQTTPAWVFTVKASEEYGGGESTLSVHKGTGRWAQVMNMETGEWGRMVYAYDATLHGANGKTHELNITRKDLQWLRKTAAA